MEVFAHRDFGKMRTTIMGSNACVIEFLVNGVVLWKRVVLKKCSKLYFVSKYRPKYQKRHATFKNLRRNFFLLRN